MASPPFPGNPQGEHHPSNVIRSVAEARDGMLLQGTEGTIACLVCGNAPG
jgi:hypothetical protein